MGVAGEADEADPAVAAVLLDDAQGAVAAQHLLQASGLVDGVELHQVDLFHPEVLEAGGDLLAHGAAGALQALGGHEQAIAVPVLQGQPETALALVVLGGGVEVGDAEVDGAVDDGHGRGVVIGEVPADAAQAEGGDRLAGAAEGAGGKGHGILLGDRVWREDSTGGPVTPREED